MNLFFSFAVCHLSKPFCIAIVWCLFIESAIAQDDGVKQETEAGQKEHTNRLADETSPYLLLHAHNPVDWYPWGEEALKKAKDENKVIFLSVGYSSCHWCHVMERESFLDEEIAEFLNENFVCIKVDREERPDIDSIYMTSLNVFNQLTRNGRGGGWPLTMFMTPDGKPFFGGTYFPARDGDRQGAPGFLTVAKRISQAWNGSRDRIMKDANMLTELVRNELSGRRDQEKGEIKAAWIEACVTGLKDRFDPVHGGFGYSEKDDQRPKFPEPSNLILLLQVAQSDSPQKDIAREMLEITLDQMLQGGIYDHVGGGFHRYSVDRYWKIPHFEKMLYDNAQLMSIYAQASEIFPDKVEYRQACEEIYQFLKREMTSPQGGFFAALDAESEGEEGKFYRWEKSELESALTKEEFELYAPIYLIDQAPNFEEKYYAPQQASPLQDLAKTNGMSVAELQTQLRRLNDKLLQQRDLRERPLRDDKILTSWNGLMIRGLADAGRILGKPEYIEAATNAANFILSNSLVDGRLKRTYTAGQSRLNGYLDDYAFLIDGLLALHQATGDDKWLAQADDLQAIQNELYWDAEAGGFFFTSNDHESLLARAKNPTDSAIPSGNSVAMGNLMYLAKALQKDEYRAQVKTSLEGSSSLITDFPTIAPRLLLPVRAFVDP